MGKMIMNRRPIKAICLFVAIVCMTQVSLGQTTQPSEAPRVRLGTIPQIKLLPTTTTAPSEQDIAKLIASLAELESPTFGLSATMSGSAFAPLKHLAHASTLMITRHGMKPNEAFQRLVELGPSAMPHLLRSITDKTPTKLTIRHDSMMGGMWFATEMDSNSASPKEHRLLQGWVHEVKFEDARIINTYTVRVGDVCFVAIGQIVGRHYSAVRYQPTACIILNSPVEEPKLARLVNDIWSAKDARAALFESLLIDYSTQGVFNGTSLDGWSVGSMTQSEAATRLLYYFPRESAQLIATRLKGLNVAPVAAPGTNVYSPTELDAYMKREVNNGVRTSEFIKAVAWCKEPAIVEAVESLRKRTTDTETLQLLDGR